MPYNPNQPRDPGGKDGGRWVKAAGRAGGDKKKPSELNAEIARLTRTMGGVMSGSYIKTRAAKNISLRKEREARKKEAQRRTNRDYFGGEGW